VVDLANAGKIPKPTKVMCANHDATHQGLKARCRGMTDAMKKIGVSVDELIIGADPAGARSIMESYLSTHKDVNYIFCVASWSSHGHIEFCSLEHSSEPLCCVAFRVFSFFLASILNGTFSSLDSLWCLRAWRIEL
jgi:DNA-binding LacI/PurR family transcriptional regulator